MTKRAFVKWPELGPTIFIIIALSTVGLMLFHGITYDIMSDPDNAGTVRCQPIGFDAGYCEQNEADIRCYNGRFCHLVGHDGEGVIFFNEERRRIQLSNVSCLIEYDTAR